MMALALKDLIPSVHAAHSVHAGSPKPVTIKPLVVETMLKQVKTAKDARAPIDVNGASEDEAAATAATATTSAKTPADIRFGGLDLLLPAEKIKIDPKSLKDTQIVQTEAWSRGLRDAEILWQEQLSVQRGKLREEFDAMKQVLAAELQRQLNGHIAEQMDMIRTMLADQLADLLQPFLAEQAHHRIIALFAEVAEQALQDSVADSPVLTGPDHLLKQLGAAVDCEKLSALVGDILPQDQQGEGEEISLQVDACIFETRLADYMTQLKEAVQDV
ncbi:hypothetical protein [uncultured Cohaesibacter sp.]|uniref:hypothetical protein n=1 Tax=uncultured Cohaesibacter sp. TaxID=1002546 RepID=UPI0029C6E1B5|nr:hypothetical protein [uncultured Cohaesibacter sp.]